MSPVNELQAKSLTLEELAERMRDHDEPAVRVFAERVLESLDELEVAEELASF